MDTGVDEPQEYVKKVAIGSGTAELIVSQTISFADDKKATDTFGLLIEAINNKRVADDLIYIDSNEGIRAFDHLLT